MIHAPLNVLHLPYQCDWRERLFPYGISIYYPSARRRIERLYDLYCLKWILKIGTEENNGQTAR